MEGSFFKGSRLFLVVVKSPGGGGGGEGGIVSFCMPRGWGIEHLLKKKSQIPGSVPGRDGNSKN